MAWGGPVDHVDGGIVDTTAERDATVSMSRIPVEQIVCEIPDGVTAPGFRWYEIALDDRAPGTIRRPAWMPADVNLVAATQVSDPSTARAGIDAALESPDLSWVLFEFLSPGHAAAVAAAVRTRGRHSIAAMHLPEGTCTAGALVDALVMMEQCGADMVKVAYHASTGGHVAAGLEALERARGPVRVPVTVVPMGTRWGRVAAAAAGSHLAFAPACATRDRPSALEMLRLLEDLYDR